MNLSDYQGYAADTAVYPGVGSNLVYPTLGLCGEAGEVAEKIKKLYRDHDGVLDAERKRLLSKELGDVLWYVAQVATEAGLDLNDIGIQNITKLRDRSARAVLGGSGDER